MAAARRSGSVDISTCSGRPWLELISRLAASLLLIASMLPNLVYMAGRDEATAAARRAGGASETSTRVGEYHIGGYLGAPHTHPSDVYIRKPPGTEVLIKDVPWEGRPFRHPIYYGIRGLAWRSDAFAAMLDFTHSKTIPAKDARLTLSGTRDGKAVPKSATVGETFRHFEFSHGHNMLAASAVLRMPAVMPRVRPYFGAGPGVNLPHTEVQFIDDPVRTYMYQLTGLMAQALVGLEVELPGGTVFLEYKFTFSKYDAPLMNVTTTLAPTDLYQQLRRWMAGRAPEGGWLETMLASHQVVAGMTGRVAGGHRMLGSR
ncbi:MAG TPA: hypothetical protein PK264_12250 [Hyphomicrobiaceae bacterium]|nr:hypothetical protein [Hyphomicrobiaceae bacterium]